jgi:uncharacterized protein YecE (DUF72 family)
VQAQRLGLLVFQFHLSFKPSEASRQAVLRCRQLLAHDIAMAAEFRNRAWFQSEQQQWGQQQWGHGHGHET